MRIAFPPGTVVSDGRNRMVVHDYVGSYLWCVWFEGDEMNQRPFHPSKLVKESGEGDACA